MELYQLSTINTVNRLLKSFHLQRHFYFATPLSFLEIIPVLCYGNTLTLSRRRPLSYRNQSIDNGLRLERLNKF